MSDSAVNFLINPKSANFDRRTALCGRADTRLRKAHTLPWAHMAAQ